MALSFIGKPIALISHSDVRYRGTLAGIDAQASTIQLSNVYSMGTEDRRPPAEFIPPVQDPYDYIIFRASEVKDLSVDEPVQPQPQQRSVHDDPAVIGASAPSQQPYGYGSVPPQSRPPAPQAQPPTVQSQAYTNGRAAQSHAQVTPVTAVSPSAAEAQPSTAPRPTQQRRGNANPIHTATASMETVERALGDLRVSSSTAHGNASGIRGGRRGGGREHAKEIKVPNTDFDFQSNNAKFDKAAIGKVDGDTTSDGDGKADDNAEPKTPRPEAAYNPHQSFFDSLSSSTQAPAGPRGGGGGGRRGGASGRNRREEERERNYATFGEPGGIGLMGPGQYVGGWGGYGRRSAGPGGGRGRRGVPAITR